MKVAELKKGMVLKISDLDKLGWLTVQHPLLGNEPELRFIPKIMASLIKSGPIITREDLIIYLGHDKVPVYDDNSEAKRTIRRVMVREKTAIIIGYNFRFLDQHPDFV